MVANDELQCAICHLRLEGESGTKWYVRGDREGYAVCAVCLNWRGARLPVPLKCFGVPTHWAYQLARPGGGTS
jgi:hypothetical protein